MAPKATKNRTPSPDPNGIFAGMVVFLVEDGVQSRRLQIWKQKLVQMGATIQERLCKGVTHVFAMDSNALHQVDRKRLERSKGNVICYQWLEDSLRLGQRVQEESYIVKLDSDSPHKSLDEEQDITDAASDKEKPNPKKIKSSDDDLENFKAESKRDIENDVVHEAPNTPSSSDNWPHIPSRTPSSSDAVVTHDKDLSLLYKPPDLNRNITEIFGKLVNIYRALGDDRRSFSYYKAIPVIEKLPFKIESADQVKDLPGIGKSLQDHIQEVVTTGKLSKLEHFETDEKVKTISLFGEVWGIGPATALKLYEKEHRTLDDLKNEDTLTHSQRFVRWNFFYKKLGKRFCQG